MKHLTNFDLFNNNLYEKIREQKFEEDFKNTKNSVFTNYTFFENLKIIYRDIMFILKKDKNDVDELLTREHNWAEDHISTAKESMEHVYNFLLNRFSHNVEENMTDNYMFFNNMEIMRDMIKKIMKLDHYKIDDIINYHDWITDHISSAKENVQQVKNLIENQIKTDYIIGESETTIIKLSINENIDQVKRVKDGIMYRGELFPGFNKPKKYTGKGKFKKRVLAKEDDNIKVLNYGHKDYSDYTKHKDPERRRNFRKRHNCDPVKNLSKLTKKYWACQDLW